MKETTLAGLIKVAWTALESDRPLASLAVSAAPRVLRDLMISAIMKYAHLPPREYFEANATLLMILLHCELEEELP